MPLGGINAGWDETVPPDSENAGLGASRIRSLETTIQQVLDSEHNFPASGGVNTGYHRLGSARVFFGPQSTVSSAGTDGRLQVASDTSTLYHTGSGGTMFLGGSAVPLINDWSLAPLNGGVTYPQRSYWAVDMGVDLNGADGNSVAFGSAFSGVPMLFLSVRSDRLINQTGYVAATIVNVTKTAFQYRLYFTSGSGTVVTTSHCSVHYWSIGTRAL